MSHRIEPAELVAEHGTTYAEQAGITLRDKPSPLWQLLVLTMLSSARISADVAAASAQEVLRAGWRTPSRLRASTWQQRVDALGRGGYRRLDESTAGYLDDAAALVLDEHRGDLRRLRGPADGDPAALAGALRRFPRVGPMGAGIFCREVQAVWPELAPFFDDRALDAARRLGYPMSPARLAGLVPQPPHVWAAALVRWSLTSRPGS